MSKKKSNKISEFLKGICLILLLIAVILGINVYLTKLNTQDTVEEQFYQYFGGVKTEYDGVMSITKKGEITELRTKEGAINLDSTPVYYKNSSKVLFPETMAKVEGSNNGKITKIEKFSTLEKEKEIIYLVRKKERKLLENSFLWDGSDMYFFLGNATLSVNNETYELSPFSYIIASYKNGVEIYNYQKDEYKIIESKDSIYVTTDNYTIDTTTDVLKYGEKEQLLLKNIDKLQAE